MRGCKPFRRRTTAIFIGMQERFAPPTGAATMPMPSVFRSSSVLFFCPIFITSVYFVVEMTHSPWK